MLKSRSPQKNVCFNVILSVIDHQMNTDHFNETMSFKIKKNELT